jgi:hypothetical protein
MSTVGGAASWVLVTVCTVLLVSYGGAIVAAPVTIPLLFLAARSSSSTSFRVWAGVVVALTIAEAAWAVTYLAFGEARPTIWLLPTLATAAGGIAYVWMSRPAIV